MRTILKKVFQVIFRQLNDTLSLATDNYDKAPGRALLKAKSIHFSERACIFRMPAGFHEVQPAGGVRQRTAM